MNTINQRLKLILDSKELKGVKVSSELEIDYRQFNNWLNQTKPSIDGLQKIIRYFPDINARWLLTGEGEMDMPEPGVAMEPAVTYKAKTDYCPLCAEKDKLIDALNDHIESLKNQLSDVKKRSNLRVVHNTGKLQMNEINYYDKIVIYTK